LGAGIGLKPAHYAAAREDSAGIAFFEVHAENHLAAGGPGARMLDWARRRGGLSIHGVGLSLGGPAPLDAAHLERIAGLVERCEPEAFSEHLAWSSHAGRYFNDLLPLPYTVATLQAVCSHVDALQTRLRRTILLENPATYLEFAASTIDEADFLAAVVARTGCGLLLDLGNVLVSACNHRRAVWPYLERLPLTAVGEIHLAGHAPDHDVDGSPLLIDSHDRAVSEPTWQLYEQLLDRIGPRPTLIEWDSALPPYARLRAEARRAADCLARRAA
jgi:uncharacterized protein (UPF0276 family)